MNKSARPAMSEKVNIWFKCAHGHTWCHRGVTEFVPMPHCPHCSDSTNGKRMPAVFVGAKVVVQ